MNGCGFVVSFAIEMSESSNIVLLSHDNPGDSGPLSLFPASPSFPLSQHCQDHSTAAVLPPPAPGCHGHDVSDQTAGVITRQTSVCDTSIRQGEGLTPFYSPSYHNEVLKIKMVRTLREGSIA